MRLPLRTLLLVSLATSCTPPPAARVDATIVASSGVVADAAHRAQVTIGDGATTNGGMRSTHYRLVARVSEHAR